MKDEQIEGNYRTLNEIEDSIIKRCIKLQRIGYIEFFIFILCCCIAVWTAMFFIFIDGEWFMGILFLLIGLGLGMFSLSLRKTIIALNKNNVFKVKKDKGNWGLEIEGSGKSQQFVSKVNDKNIRMPIPNMAIPPKEGGIKYVTYEYIMFLDFEPAFGFNNLFISIDGVKLTERDKVFMSRLKPIGILSIVFSAAFFVCCILSFAIQEEFLFFICLPLFFIFIRTLFIWGKNSSLRSKFYPEIYGTIN